MGLKRGQRMKVLVLGGTGVISRNIVSRLLANNCEVAVYNRGSRKLAFAGEGERIVGDRQNREQFEAAMQSRRFDAVIDMICFNAQDAQSTLRAFRGNTGHLVMTSSVAAYKRPYHTVPTVEDAEELWDDPAFGYAYHKAAMERCLAKAAKEEKLPLTIIRPSLTYGPGAANIGVLRQNYGIIDRIRKGKPLVMFGDGTTPWSWTFAPDLARGYVSILGNPKTFGKAYHVCSEERRIWEDVYLEFGRIVGVEPKIVHVPSAVLQKAAPNLCGHLFWEKSHAGLFDNSKFRAVVPGFTCNITLSQGLRMIAEWFETEANIVDPEKDALEDQLVGRMTELTAAVADLYTK